MIGPFAPGATFEAWKDGYATGLTGTLGVRIKTAAGASFLARTTTGITEDVTGVYKRSFTAPTTQGDYVLVWDDTTTFKADSFTVSYSSPATVAATGRDLCSLTDVTAIVPGYTAGDDAPTDAVLQRLLSEQSRDAMERCGREVTPITTGSSTRLFDTTEAFYRRRKLKIGDAATVTAVTVQDTAGATIQTLTATQYALQPRVREDWQPYSTVWFLPTTGTPPDWVWWTGPAVIAVTGTWGFPLVPTTLKDAVARLTVVRYLNDVAGAGTNFSEAADRAEFNIAASIRTALDAIDRFHIPSV